MKKLSARDIAYVSLGTAVISLCSWISIPAEIPFTLQTFAICLVTAILGLRLGVWTVAVYLMLGFVGAPVFAGFRGGFGVLLGTTGGYIIGFVFTALCVGLAVKLYGRRLIPLIAGMVLGIIICYAFGTAWFIIVYTKNSGSIGIATALAWCVLPYLVPDAIKIAIAAPLAVRLGRIIEPKDKKHE